MASVSVIITTPKDTSALVKSGQPRGNLKRVANILRGMESGALLGNVKLTASTADAVAATGTFTLASVVATDAVTIAGVTFTFTSTPSLETDVEVDGADNTADAAALAAAINAHSTIKHIIYATSALAVVTLTCRVPGVIGNFIAISDADTTITTSASYLAGGTGGSGSIADPLTIGR